MKKLVSLLLVISVMTSSGFAISTQPMSSQQDTAKASVQILAAELFQTRFDESMDLLAGQRAEQNALDMVDVYEDILYPMVRSQVYAELGIAPLAEDVGFYAPNGGVLSYEQPREWGVPDVPVVVTCLTKQQSSDEIAGISTGSVGGAVSLSGLFTTFIEKIPGFAMLSVPATAIGSFRGDVRVSGRVYPI